MMGLGLADRHKHMSVTPRLIHITLITAALEYKSFRLAPIVRVSHSQKVERSVITSCTLFRSVLGIPQLKRHEYRMIHISYSRG
jgi:hypothetical protein